MRVVKWIVILLLAYAGIVVLFESLIGYFQPSNESTLVITTRDADGAAHDRVVSRLEVGERLYVAANHWPRAWYARALENPDVEVDLDGDGDRGRYVAVPVEAEEHARVNAAHPLPLPFRFLTGFPPRIFLRLDPR